MSARNGKWGITLSTCFPKKIRIFDPILRDEEQTSGVSLTAENKLRIAKRLDELGVDVIEAGFASEDKMEAVKHIVKEGLRAEISSCSRGAKGDIDAVVEMNVLMADYNKSGDSWAKNFLKEGWATIRGTLVSWGYRREGSLPRIETASLSFRPKRFVKENSVFLPLSPSIKLMIVGCLAKKRYQSND